MVIDGLGEYLSEKERNLCELLPLAVITSASGPSDTAVICQVAVAVPFLRVPTLKVGVATVKWLFCEVNVNETLVRSVYPAEFTRFSMTTFTVDV